MTTVVVGAGPAGLAAALILVEGGENVILVERSSDLGGKVRTMADQGRSYEHGVHGWWPAYVNFDRMLRVAGVAVEDSLRPGMDIRIIVEGGQQLKLSPLRSHVPSPLSMLVQSIRTPLLTTGDMLRLGRIGIHLLAFDPARDTAAYERLTFAELLEYAGVTDNAKRLLFAPFAKAFAYSTLEGINAAAAMAALRFYVLPSDRRSVPRWLVGSSEDLVIGPVVSKLTDLGATVLRGVTVEALRVRPEGGVEVVVDGIADLPPGLPLREDATTALGTVSRVSVDTAAGGLETAVQGVPILVRRTSTQASEQSYEAIVRTCTHAGCETSHVGTTFLCPCHGGRFDDAGNPVGGPPQRPLGRLTVEVSGTEIVLSREAPRIALIADHVVIATDPLATRDIFAGTDAPQELHHNLGHLQASSVLVIRFWFREISDQDKPQAALTPLLPMVDAYFCISRMEPLETGGLHLVEIQVAGIKPHYLDLSDDALVALALEDLKVISADYCANKVVDTRVLRHLNVFATFPVPEVPPLAAEPLSGVHVVGDWTRRPGNSWMMERAVVSGVHGAAQILGTQGGSKISALSPEPEGAFLRWCSFCAFLLRSIVRGGFDVPPSLTPEEMMNHDRVDHVINGWAALAIGAAATLSALSMDFALLSKVWPFILLATNVYFFLHVEPWVRATYGSWFRSLSDRHTFQHRIMTCGGIAVAAVEIALALEWIHGDLWRALFPVGVIVFGALFTLHHSGEDPLVDRQHSDIGFLSIAIGVSVGLSRFFAAAEPLNVVWGVLFVIQSYFFITYTATPLHDHSAGPGDGPAHDHVH